MIRNIAGKKRKEKKKMPWLPFSLRYVLVLVIFHSQLISSSSSPSPGNRTTNISPQCHSDERSALLQLKADFPFVPADPSFVICRSYRSDSDEEETPYQTMASWGKSVNCCKWDGVECDGDSGHIVGLNLMCSSLQGPIRSNSSLFSLRHLKTLDLSSNDFRGLPIPAEFGQFGSMTTLDLSYSNFGGDIPPEIARLSKLVSFTLYAKGERAIRIGPVTFAALSRNLTKLAELRLRDVDMSSIPIGSFTNLSSSVTTIELSSCDLPGKLPENGFRLPNLENLLLAGNQIDGRIPIALLSHDKLQSLNLGVNNLAGPIPEVVYRNSSSNFSSLTSLALFRNKLEGSIPSWVYTIPSFTVLDLSENRLTGEVSEFESSSLYAISLRRNKLHGVIPRGIFQRLSSLEMFDVSSNNFTGDFELQDLSNLVMLSSFDISSNSLSFRFDNSKEYTFGFLYYLGLSACNITEFPSFLRSLTSLDSLDLSRNRIHGVVPQWLWETRKDSLTFLNLADNFLTQMDPLPWNNLQVLDLRSNLLRGPLPISFSPLLSVFQASKNQLSGELSASLCNMTSLLVLNLSYNNLTGEFPSCFQNFSSDLSVLDLRMNKFRGSIPFSFVKGNYLRTLNLNGNEFDGSLPRSLIECRKLEVLDVGNNKIDGEFPRWLESLPELQVLILRSNNFHGSISKNASRSPFQKLRIMDLSNNKFTGLLPETYFRNFAAMMDSHSNELSYLERDYYGGIQYYQDSVVLVMKGLELKLEKILTILTTIDLSNNKFGGQIPDAVAKLKSLKGLNFSQNNLIGPIPGVFGNLTSLEWLDLSSNELSGPIPRRLTGMIQLNFLNLSHNRLEGHIPAGKQFNTFGIDSYHGNPGLCGFPVSKSCSKDDPEEDNGVTAGEEGITLEWKVVMMGYASGVVIGASIGYMLLNTRRFRYLFIKRFGRKRRHISIVPVGGRQRI